MNKRCFGGGHGHGPAPKAPNGLAPILQHLDGSHEHHHDHVHAADLNHKFIQILHNFLYLNCLIASIMRVSIISLITGFSKMIWSPYPF